jgi:hypothetical protein
MASSSAPPTERRLSSADALLRAIGEAPLGLTLPDVVSLARDEQPADVLRWIELARDRGVIDEVPPLDRESGRRFVLGASGRRLLDYDPRRRSSTEPR